MLTAALPSLDLPSAQAQALTRGRLSLLRYLARTTGYSRQQSYPPWGAGAAVLGHRWSSGTSALRAGVDLSGASLTNLRGTAGYRARRQQGTKTRPTASIGSAVGIVATCERFTEAYVLPVIKAVLEGFPFTISGFHADNGSEYQPPGRRPAGEAPHRTHPVSPAPFERQRPGRDQELRRGAQVLRRQPSRQRYAMQINAFCAAYLKSYRNFHRPLPVRRGHQ